MAKREPEKKPLKFCSRCYKDVKDGHYEEITTRRRTKLILCTECVRKGL